MISKQCFYVQDMTLNYKHNHLNMQYKADRGAHTYWLEKGISDVHPDHILNLIHYEVSEFLYCYFHYPSPFFIFLNKLIDYDHLLHLYSQWCNLNRNNGLWLVQDAASLSIAILKKKLRGRIFLGCDNHPLSRSFCLPNTFTLSSRTVYTYKDPRCNYHHTFLNSFRQEVMELVDKSGKYGKKFGAFTGKYFAIIFNTTTLLFYIVNA